MRPFLWGMLTMASATVALFFLRYWSRTRDRLFGFFALAFAVMAANWANHIGLSVQSEAREYRVYIIRFVAFLIIIVGIIDKNRRSRRALRRPSASH
jgi:predicted membrane-bound spermidine synthase